MRATNVLLGLLTTAALARSLGPADYSMFVSLIAVDALSNVLAEWSTSAYLVREHIQGRDTLAEVIAARLVSGPVCTWMLMAILVAAIGPTPELISSAALVAAPSLLYFASSHAARAQRDGHMYTYSLFTQLPGAAWSALAVGSAALGVGLIGVSALFALVSSAAALAQVRALRSALGGYGPLHAVLTSAAGVRAGLGLLGRLRSDALIQVAVASPTRLVAPVSVMLFGPAVAGPLVVATRFLDQSVIPAISYGSVALRPRSADEARDELPRIVLALSLAGGLLAIPLSYFYLGILIGDDYESLGSALVWGIGYSISAGVTAAIGPGLLARQGRGLAKRVALAAWVGLICFIAAGQILPTVEPARLGAMLSLCLGLPVLLALVVACPRARGAAWLASTCVVAGSLVSLK